MHPHPKSLGRAQLDTNEDNAQELPVVIFGKARFGEGTLQSVAIKAGVNWNDCVKACVAGYVAPEELAYDECRERKASGGSAVRLNRPWKDFSADEKAAIENFVKLMDERMTTITRIRRTEARNSGPER